MGLVVAADIRAIRYIASMVRATQMRRLPGYWKLSSHRPLRDEAEKSKCSAEVGVGPLAGKEVPEPLLGYSVRANSIASARSTEQSSIDRPDLQLASGGSTSWPLWHMTSIVLMSPHRVHRRS